MNLESENYCFSANIGLTCKDCNSTDLSFQTFEQGKNEGDAIVYCTDMNKKSIILGVDCNSCSSGYELNIILK